MKKAIRWIPVAAAALLLAQCATVGFYTQAIGGQLRLMHQRQAIQELLDAHDTDPGLKDQLSAVVRIRRFASGNLGLPDNGSYGSFVATGKEAAVWNVVAAPADSLEAVTWCFPVAGCVPYRGYFKKDRALAFAERLARKGLDVAVTPAVAYSTLGWFEDPLLDTMLAYPDYRLAELIFHELAHQLLYVKDDAEFNESFATLVARAGVRRWLGTRPDPGQAEAWKRYRDGQDRFNRLLAQTREELQALYVDPQRAGRLRDDKHAIFERLRERYAAETAGEGRGVYSAWLAQDLNNAHFALHATYEAGVAAFACLLREHGGEFEAFYRAAEAIGRQPAEARRAWLSSGRNAHCASA